MLSGLSVGKRVDIVDNDDEIKNTHTHYMTIHWPIKKKKNKLVCLQQLGRINEEMKKEKKERQKEEKEKERGRGNLGKR